MIDAYVDVLVDTAVTDLDISMLAVPAPLAGVFAAWSEVLEHVSQMLAQAERDAVTAAYLSALQAATPRTPAITTTRCTGDFDCFKVCTLRIESNGDYAAISPGGTYRGAWQFDQTTWNGAVARAGHPEWSGRDPAQAPPDVQDAAARQLYSERGNQPWGGRC